MEILYPVSGAALREVRRAPEYRYDNTERRPAMQVFQFTRAGRGWYEEGGRRQWAPPGWGMLFAYPEPSAYGYAEGETAPWTFGWFSVRGAESLWAMLREPFGSVVPVAGGGLAMALAEEIAGRVERQSFLDRYHASELVYRFVMALARELHDSETRLRSPVEFGARYLDDHHTRPIGVKEAAERAGLSREHFIRRFTAERGQSPGRYLREMRLATAERLLRASRLEIAAVARQSGFSSASHFCRAFRKSRGLPPERFRAAGPKGGEGGTGVFE